MKKILSALMLLVVLNLGVYANSEPINLGNTGEAPYVVSPTIPVQPVVEQPQQPVVVQPVVQQPVVNYTTKKVNNGNNVISVATEGSLVQEVTIDDLINIFVPHFKKYFLIFLAFFILFYIIVTGMHIIKNHKNKDEVKKSLTSFLYIALGAFIIGASAIIASFFIGGMQPTNSFMSPQQITVAK